MTTFVLDCDNNIIAFDSRQKAELANIAGARMFSSQQELEALDLGASRLVEIWNGFAGAVPFDDLRPVKKFENRHIAAARIWQAVQRLAPKTAAPAPANAAAAPKTKGPKPAGAKPAPRPQGGAQARDGSKKAGVLALLRRADGATLAEIMAATGWQAHTVRGFISGTLSKKMGIQIESFKTPEGDRAYRLS
jgi:hypothetical protein